MKEQSLEFVALCDTRSGIFQTSVLSAKCHQRRAKLTFPFSNCLPPRLTVLPDVQQVLLLEQHVDVVDAKRRQLLVWPIEAHEKSTEGDVTFATGLSVHRAQAITRDTVILTCSCPPHPPQSGTLFHNTRNRTCPRESTRPSSLSSRARPWCHPG